MCERPFAARSRARALSLPLLSPSPCLSLSPSLPVYHSLYPPLSLSLSLSPSLPPPPSKIPSLPPLLCNAVCLCLHPLAADPGRRPEPAPAPRRRSGLAIAWPRVMVVGRLGRAIVAASGGLCPSQWPNGRRRRSRPPEAGARPAAPSHSPAVHGR